MNVAERAKEFNKENYKQVKVYIKKEDYPIVKKRADNTGQKVSGYIKSLIEADISRGGVKWKPIRGMNGPDRSGLHSAGNQNRLPAAINSPLCSTPAHVFCVAHCFFKLHML